MVGWLRNDGNKANLSPASAGTWAELGNIYTRVGTPHITPHTIQKQGGTPHMNLCSDVHTGVGTRHRITEEKTSMVGVGVGVVK